MTYEMYLSHHGIKGQKWGVRRYQNKDGTLTVAGKKRYSPGNSESSTSAREIDKVTSMLRSKEFSDFKSEVYKKLEKEGFDQLQKENLYDGIQDLKVPEMSRYSESQNREYLERLLKEYGRNDLTVEDLLKTSYDKFLEEMNSAWKEENEYWKKKMAHSSERGTDFKMTNNFIELSEVLASLDPEYLAHHGIKGQKWGVEHGPPYPLKSGVSARIKRAAKSVRNRVEENRKQRAVKKEAKEAKRRKKNPTLQDRINAMSDEELRQRTDRLRLENAYKRELPNEKQGENFLRKSAKALNELKTFGDAVSGFIETGKKVSHAFGLDKLDGDDENPARRSGESLKDYTQRMAQLASLKKSRDTLGTSSSSIRTKEEEKTTSPTYTARKASTSESGQWWKRDNISSDDPRLSDLRDEAKKWNVDIDKPVERVWDYSDKGNDWFKESFSSGGKPSSRPIDFTKDDDDEKKKKGG